MGYTAFTTKSSTLVRELRNEVWISSRYVEGASNSKPTSWRGLWDTGASSSCIHKRVQKQLGLKALGTTSISTANGLVEVDTVLIDVTLPNRVIISDLMVSCADIGDDVDILLGMDIIGFGNFSVSNGNETYHSLMIPSDKHIDFTKIANLLNKVEQSHRKKSK